MSKKGKQLEPYYKAGRNVKWCSHLENVLEVPQKAEHRTTIWSSNSTPRFIPKIIEKRGSK